MTKTKSWRDVLPVHPAADLFPLMSEVESRELGEDIKKHGLSYPVTLWRDDADGGRLYLLDGRNRLDAMEQAKITFYMTKYALRTPDGKTLSHTLPEKPGLYALKTDPYAFVLSANINRRHLTAEQKRKLIADVLKAKPEKSNNQIANEVKADDQTVAKVRADLESRSEIPNVETRTDTKGRKQPSAKPKKQTLAVNGGRVDASQFSPEAQAAIAAQTGEVDIEVRKADMAALDAAPAAKRTDQWQTSLGNLAGDAITMEAYWKHQFGEWEKFEVTSDLVTLAEQAADAWNNLAGKLRKAKADKAAA